MMETLFSFTFYFSTGSLASSNIFSTSPVILSLNSGDTFGFRAETLTNDGGVGALSVTDFDVQAVPVPFEFEGSAGILTIGAIWGVNKWRKNRLKK